MFLPHQRLFFTQQLVCTPCVSKLSVVSPTPPTSKFKFFSMANKAIHDLPSFVRSASSTPSFHCHFSAAEPWRPFCLSYVPCLLSPGLCTCYQARILFYQDFYMSVFFSSLGLKEGSTSFFCRDGHCLNDSTLLL